MKKVFILPWVFLFCFFSASQAQVITTIAGNGIAGFSGDGGPATAAELSVPIGVAIDGMGNIYIGDAANHRIRKMNNAGIISTVAGTGVVGYSGDGGPATLALLATPSGVVADGSGNVYFADQGNSHVRKVNTAGVIANIAGNGISGYTGDGGPATDAEIGSVNNVAIDTSGIVYITDGTHNVVRKVDVAGIISTFAGTGIGGYSGDGGPATAAQLNGPVSVTTDLAGNVYIADQENYRVRKVDTAGIITTFAGNGTSGLSGDGGPANSAEFSAIYGIFADNGRNIYVVDRSNGRIRKVDTSGIIITIAGGGAGPLGDGGPATAATLNRPDCVTRYRNENIYISDVNNNRIRMIITKPYFINGELQHAAFCHGTLNLDTLLAANDSNSGNTELWSLIYGPFHGSASVAFTATSTGNIIYPTGLSYTSTPGYTGLDTFSVRVTDGIISDTVTTYVTIQAGPCNAEVAGIAENDAINLYPNPNDGTFTLTFPANSTGPAHIIITNIVGEKIKEITLPIAIGMPLTIQMDAPSGVYFLSAVTKEGEYNTKVVVTK